MRIFNFKGMQTKIKFIFSTLFIAVIFFQCSEPTAESQLLTDDGSSKYSIIIPKNPSAVERQAAEYLKQNLQNITKASLPILTDGTPETKNEIVLGNSARADRVGIDLEAVGPEGYAIKTVDQKLIMYSPKAGEGAMNAVNDFLISVGMNRFIPNMTIYRIDTFLALPQVDIVFNPPFTLRSIDNKGTNNPEFLTWHKVTNIADDRSAWGNWDMDLEGWFHPDRHPELFSDGVPLPDIANCLTNDNLFQIIKQQLADRIRVNGAAKYWIISPLVNGEYCTCEGCEKINQQEASPSGALVQFVNRLAKEFPNKTIASLVQEDALLPATTVPANNVMIVLSTKDINRSLPIESDEYNASFRENLDDWLKQTNQIMILEHLVQVNNPVSPFPVLHTLAENLQFYAEKGIDKVHIQGSHETGAELSELKTYVASRLLWDPTIELDYLISSFSSEFYGTAGDYITRYINLLQEQSAKYGSLLTIGDNPTVHMKTHLRQELMDQYNYFFNQAEEVIKADPEIRDRVKIARLPLVYSSLEHARINGTDKRGLFLNLNGRWMAVPGMQTLASDFASECNRLGVKFLDNIAGTPQSYADNIMEFTAQPVTVHKAMKQLIALRRPPSQKYSNGNADLLIDGLLGDSNHRYGWVGYQEYDLESTLTFKEPVEINQIQARFKHDPDQKIYAPKRVNIQISNNGKDFTGIGSNTVPSKNAKGIQTFTFAVKKPGIKAIKVNGVNIQTIPEGQPGAGESSWVFADEILVN